MGYPFSRPVIIHGLSLTTLSHMADEDQNVESWGWIAIWFVGSFLVMPFFPLLGLFSLGLEVFFGAANLLK